MHHTGKKESKKKEKKEGHEKFASRRFEPGPSEYVRTKSERLYPLDHLGKGWQLKRYIFLLYGDWQFLRKTFQFPCRIKSLTDWSQT